MQEKPDSAFELFEKRKIFLSRVRLEPQLLGLTQPNGNPEIRLNPNHLTAYHGDRLVNRDSDATFLRATSPFKTYTTTAT